jgi:hypothetical protein
MDLHDDTQWTTVTQKSFSARNNNRNQHGHNSDQSGRGGRGNSQRSSQRSYKYRSANPIFQKQPAPVLTQGINQLRNPGNTKTKTTTQTKDNTLRQPNFLIDNEGGYYDALLAPDDDATTDSVSAALAAAAALEEAERTVEYEEDFAITAEIPTHVLSPSRQLNPDIQSEIARHNPYPSEGLRKRVLPPTGPQDGPRQGA